MMISVIIPVYNTDKFLKKCLDSIINQTYIDFEVIMVDDGSTDNSANICKSFVNKDSRFKYFYKENGGSSSARNLGLRKAKGDYVAFIDSDDYIDSDYLEVLSEGCKDGYDIIQCGMRLVRKGIASELVPSENEYHNIESIMLILKREYPIFLFQVVHTKLYRRAFIEKCRVEFDESVSKSEDCLFNTYLLPNVSSVKTIQAAKYNYCQDNSFLSKQIMDYSKIYQNIRVGIITAKIRYETIMRYHLNFDNDIIKGFQITICIIYLSNAREIETNNLSKEEKKRLYNFYFSEMNYSIDKVVNNLRGTDKLIALASQRKKQKMISGVYFLKRIKSKIKK